MPASLAILIAMTVAVAGVAVYRRIVIRSKSDALQIADSSGQVFIGPRAIVRKLKQIDRLGIGLTVATVLYGMAWFAVFLYRGFMDHTLG
jgi:hypothetical protein